MSHTSFIHYKSPSFHPSSYNKRVDLAIGIINTPSSSSSVFAPAERAKQHYNAKAGNFVPQAPTRHPSRNKMQLLATKIAGSSVSVTTRFPPSPVPPGRRSPNTTLILDNLDHIVTVHPPYRRRSASPPRLLYDPLIDNPLTPHAPARSPRRPSGLLHNSRAHPGTSLPRIHPRRPIRPSSISRRTIAAHDFLALARDGEGARVTGQEEDEQDEEDEGADGAEDYSCDCSRLRAIDLVSGRDDGCVLAPQM